MSRSLQRIALVTVTAHVFLPGTALATFHEWRIDQIYSNPSGTVQFVELSDIEDGETFLQNHTVKSATHTFTFPSNLPAGTPTAGHHLLLATPGYFALAGVPAADFNLGIDNFFNIAGDTLNYAEGLNVVTFGAGQLPSDGLHALSVSRSAVLQGSVVNDPGNLPGNSLQIPAWENQDNRFSADGNSAVAPLDALQVINELISKGPHALVAPSAGNAPPPFLDVNGDNTVSALDALQIINQLISPSVTSHSQTFLAASPAALPLASAHASALNVPEPATLSLAAIAAVVLLSVISLRRQARRARRFASAIEDNE